MRRRTELLLAATASLLTACAGTTGGMQRATPPAYATGAGLGGGSQAAPAAPSAAPGHDHHTRAERPYGH